MGIGRTALGAKTIGAAPCRTWLAVLGIVLGLAIAGCSTLPEGGLPGLPLGNGKATLRRQVEQDPFPMAGKTLQNSRTLPP